MIHKENDWIKVVLNRLCKENYLKTRDCHLFSVFFNLITFVECSEIDEIYTIIKNFDKKSTAEIEEEVWRIRNVIFKGKNGDKIIAVCFLFDTQVQKKSFNVYLAERAEKLKFISTLIARVIAKNFVNY